MEQRPEREVLIGLQIMRAVAASLVVVFHVGEYLRRKGGIDSTLFDLFGFGGIGVHLFFMISGYIIFYVHADDIGTGSRFGAYMWKRVTRIYPPYLIITAALVGTCFFRASCGADYHHSVASVALSALLVPENHSPYLGVAWTLTHEMFFYLLFSLLILSRRAGIAVMAAWTAGIVYYALAVDSAAYPKPASDFPLNFVFSPNNLFFVAGLLIALVQRRYRLTLRGYAFPVGLALLIPFGALELNGVPFSVTAWVLVAGATLMLLSSGSIPNARPLALAVFLGNASYSIYLLHNPMFGALVPAAKWAGLLGAPDAFGLLMLVAALAGGGLYYLAVEKPSLAIARQLAARIRGRAQLQATH